MEIIQVHDFVNSALTETLGSESILNEDLSNVVDMGNAVFNANAFDAFVKSLVNHIGRVVFVNRPYRGSAPSVLMDAWEYGSVVEKIASELPTAVENESWELEDGASYDPNVFHAPRAESKFFNKMTTFEVDRSITERQVKQSFSSATQLNAFVSMLFNEVEKSLTIANDNLIMRTINNMIVETMYSAYTGGAITGAGNTRAINLLSRYNTQYSESLTAAQAIVDPDFIRYAVYQMGLVIDRLTRISTLFNVGGKARFVLRLTCSCRAARSTMSIPNSSTLRRFRSGRVAALIMRLLTPVRSTRLRRLVILRLSPVFWAVCGIGTRLVS